MNYSDTDLNENGTNQAALVGETLSTIPFDSFYSSDLKRCQQTSKQIHDRLKTPVDIKLNSGLRERFMGEVQGLNIDEAIRFASAQGKHFKEFGELAPVFLERLNKLLNEILKENTHSKNVLLVSHGGTIRTLLKLLDYHGDLVVYNTSITSIDFDRHDFTKFKILTIGDTRHLGSGIFKVLDSRVR